jgi:hypothetical protein
MSTTSEIKTTITQIRSREKQHVELLHAVFKADADAIFPADLIVAGAIQRSLMLCKGFLTLLRAKNGLCAGAVLRLQVDNILRLYASSLFPSGSDTLLAILEDWPLSRLKAPDGKPLTDRELCNRVAAIYPWVPSVFKHTSAFVHFSRPAVMSALTSVSDDRRFTLSIGSRVGRPWRPSERLEAAQAFDAATKAVLEMVYAWGHAKARVARKRARPGSDDERVE